MNRSAMVAPNRPKATVSASNGCFSQCRNTKGITTRIAAGLLDRAVMASSGSHSRDGQLHLDARRPKSRTQASMKISDLRGGLGIGTLDPIVAREHGRQRPESAPIMGI